jgi:hypothetical protein
MPASLLSRPICVRSAVHLLAPFVSFAATASNVASIGGTNAVFRLHQGNQLRGSACLNRNPDSLTPWSAARVLRRSVRASRVFQSHQGHSLGKGGAVCSERATEAHNGAYRLSTRSAHVKVIQMGNVGLFVFERCPHGELTSKQMSEDRYYNRGNREESYCP